MRYLVIAIKWDDKVKKQVKYVAGAFDEYMNARLFTEAYNSYYKANAIIEEANALLNN